jgi:diacylglycerol kinase family enzyme
MGFSGPENIAKELGIPEDISDAVHLALTGDPKKISPGRINGHYFVLMTGIGFDGEAVYSLKHSLKKISGKGAYILSGFRTFLKYRTPPIFVKTSEGMISGYSAVVGKSSCYGGYFKVTPKACLTEPLLDLCLLKKGGRKALFGFISRVIGNKHLDVEDVYYGKFPEIEINSNETVHVQTDGDYFGTLPVKIDVHKDAVQLVW